MHRTELRQELSTQQSSISIFHSSSVVRIKNKVKSGPFAQNIRGRLVAELIPATLKEWCTMKETARWVMKAGTLQTLPPRELQALCVHAAQKSLSSSHYHLAESPLESRVCKQELLSHCAHHSLVLVALLPARTSSLPLQGSRYHCTVPALSITTASPAP